MGSVIALVRGLVSLALIAGVVWCSFRVPLGRRTFAEHADRIGQTPEARELVDSTRQTVTPALQDATDRMLGEYIEAPTKPPPGSPAAAAAVPARTKPPSRLPRASSVDRAPR